jgi:hypothetical protein
MLFGRKIFFPSRKMEAKQLLDQYKYCGIIIVVLVIVLILIVVFSYRTSQKQTVLKYSPKTLRATATDMTSTDFSVTGRYIKISKSSGFFCFENLIAYDPNGKDLVPNGFSSSTQISFSDFLKNTTVTPSYDSPTTFVTGSADQGSPNSRFVLVDFGSDVKIARIILTLRKDIFRNLMAGAVIQILDSNSNPVFVSSPLPMIGSELSINTPESTDYMDTGIDKMYQKYSITTPNQLPTGYSLA